MYLKSFKNSLEKVHFYKVVGKEPAVLLKYEFLYEYFSEVLFRFPEHLFSRTLLNGSEHL